MFLMIIGERDQIRFRQMSVAFAGDISKMYNSRWVLEKRSTHSHRFLWGDIDTQREPDHYVLQTVTLWGQAKWSNLYDGFTKDSRDFQRPIP